MELRWNYDGITMGMGGELHLWNDLSTVSLAGRPQAQLDVIDRDQGIIAVAYAVGQGIDVRIAWLRSVRATVRHQE